MEATLQTTDKRSRQRNKRNGHISLDPDLLLKLYELLQGERDLLRVYSQALQCDVCFVNPHCVKMEQLEIDCPVYTTRELAYVISLSEDDFRRFHYLKTRLVG
ncbi:MAG: hypothetical protein Kow0042_30000 [Calditrichia bacterium]